MSIRVSVTVPPDQPDIVRVRISEVKPDGSASVLEDGVGPGHIGCYEIDEASVIEVRPLQS